MMRATYSTRCRFNRNDATESVIWWKECDPNALSFPGDQAICNTELELEPWTEFAVGEVAGAPRPIALRYAPVGTGRGHICGTEDDFAHGGLRDTTIPDVRYAINGLPVCCNPAPTPRGGAAAGGSVVPSYTPAPPPAGQTCGTAGTLVMGQLRAQTSPTTPTADWWGFPVVAGTTYHVRLTPNPIPNLTVTFFRGASCAFALSFHPVFHSPSCYSFVAVANQTVWVTIGGTSGPVGYTIVADTGPC